MTRRVDQQIISRIEEERRKREKPIELARHIRSKKRWKSTVINKIVIIIHLKN